MPPSCCRSSCCSQMWRSCASLTPRRPRPARLRRPERVVQERAAHAHPRLAARLRGARAHRRLLRPAGSAKVDARLLRAVCSQASQPAKAILSPRRLVGLRLAALGLPEIPQAEPVPPTQRRGMAAAATGTTAPTMSVCVATVAGPVSASAPLSFRHARRKRLRASGGSPAAGACGTCARTSVSSPSRRACVLFIRASPQPARPGLRVGGDALTAGAARLTTSLAAWEAALRHPRSTAVGVWVACQ